jgi:hypothetical protein
MVFKKMMRAQVSGATIDTVLDTPHCQLVDRCAGYAWLPPTRSRVEHITDPVT